MPRESQPSGPFVAARKGAGVAVRIRVKPGAAQERVRGLVQTKDGPAIEVAVSAPPADGRANAALLAALAAAWRVPKSALTIVSGNKSRIKTILISGEPRETLSDLTAWLGRLPPEKDA